METLSEKFAAYHEANPHIYQMFRSYSLQALERGYSKFSAKAVFERLRWHYQMERANGDDFKLNNNYTAYYARMLMEREPELFRDFFELRERKAA